MPHETNRWFQHFPVESEERSDFDVVWSDEITGSPARRQPTRAEKLSIILIGVASIGFIVLLIVTVLVAVYISRR